MLQLQYIGECGAIEGPRGSSANLVRQLGPPTRSANLVRQLGGHRWLTNRSRPRGERRPEEGVGHSRAERASPSSGRQPPAGLGATPAWRAPPRRGPPSCWRHRPDRGHRLLEAPPGPRAPPAGGTAQQTGPPSCPAARSAAPCRSRARPLQARPEHTPPAGTHAPDRNTRPRPGATQLITPSQSLNMNMNRPIASDTRAITVKPNEAPKPTITKTMPVCAAHFRGPLCSFEK